MRAPFWASVLAATFLLDGGTTAVAAPTRAADCGSAAGTTGQAVCLANAFTATLTAEQRAAVQVPFTRATAARWTNLPCGGQCRNGLLFSTLTPAQQTAALALARAALSTAGYDTFAAIRTADDSLRVSGGGRSYGSGVYLIAFVGTPSTSSRWMLQLSGHHYALNLAFNGPAARVAATPFFVGLEPETLTVNGTRSSPLAARRDAVYTVLASLDSSQRAAAKLDRTFTDVLLGPGQDGEFPTQQGVAVSSLSSAQQALVKTAIEQWVHDLPAADAAALLAAYESAPALASTTVAYAGAPTPSVPGSYVRIDGPRVWIEFSCQKGYIFPSQVHYHTIWRDRRTDYGGPIPASAPAAPSNTRER